MNSKTIQEQWEPVIALTLGMILLILAIFGVWYFLESHRYHPEPMIHVYIDYEGFWNASVTLSTGENYSNNYTGRGTFICYLDYGEKVHVYARKMDDGPNLLNVTIWRTIGESKIVETGSTKEPYGTVELDYTLK